MNAKVIKTGNSRALIIPRALADALDLKAGDTVRVEPIASGLLVTRKRSRRSVPEAAERFIKRHDDLFRELAKR